jgi:hypothetical protein
MKIKALHKLSKGGKSASVRINSNTMPSVAMRAGKRAAYAVSPKAFIDAASSQ